jgi:hypothetical protein
MRKFIGVLLVLVLVASSAQALIVLPVPGETGNTVRTSDGGTDWMGSGETATTWRNRSLAEVGGDNWAGVSGLLPYSAYANSTASTAPELLTTVTGFEAYEEVEVWVLFNATYNNDGSLRKNNWIDAAIDDGSMTTALTAYSVQAGNAVSTGLIARQEASLYYGVVAGYMGTATADDNGTIFLRADSRLSVPEGMTGVSAGDRTIFHGYALYEIPEPATMALLGFGAMALLRKRK